MSKDVIKIDESKLREIVSESVRKALLGNGKYQDVAVTNQWVGETEPFEAIMNSAQAIMNQFAQYKKAGKQYGPSAQIYQWAKSVYEQANNWLNANMY